MAVVASRPVEKGGIAGETGARLGAARSRLVPTSSCLQLSMRQRNGAFILVRDDRSLGPPDQTSTKEPAATRHENR